MSVDINPEAYQHIIDELAVEPAEEQPLFMKLKKRDALDDLRRMEEEGIYMELGHPDFRFGYDREIDGGVGIIYRKDFE